MKNKIVKGQRTAPDPSTNFKAEKPETQKYLFALEKENLKLQKQIAKLQAQNTMLRNRIKVLEMEQYRPKAQLIIKGLHDEPPVK